MQQKIVVFFLICAIVQCLAESGKVTFKNVEVRLSGNCYFFDYEHNLTITKSNRLGQVLEKYPQGKCIEIINQSIPVFYRHAIANVHGELLNINNCGIRELQPGAFQNSVIKSIYIEDNKELETLKRGVFEGLTEHLSLGRNGIKYIENGAFESISPTHLNLKNNHLEELPLGVFNNLSVVYLDLRENKIKKIHKGAFGNNLLLIALNLEDNSIDYIEPGAFENTPNLAQLFLSKNYMTHIACGIFNNPIWKSIDLSFEYNNINYIEPGAFSTSTFYLLSLAHNKLEDIKNGTFSKSKIEELILSSNSIDIIEEGAFNADSLKTIDLGKNKLRIIRKGTFRHYNISYINLYDNDIERIESDAFNPVLTGLFLEDENLTDASKTYLKSLDNVYLNSNFFKVSRYYIH